MTKDSSDKDTTPRESTRMPFETRVNIEFEKFSGFISEYCSNISSGGMFIQTDEPKPIGTILSFEFKLADNFKLIQGLGEVSWVRANSLGPEKPAGMGIRFHEIDASSQELIATMVDQYVKRGGKPFELEEEGKEAMASAPKGPDAVEDDFRALFASGTEPSQQTPPEPLDEPTPPSPLDTPTEEVVGVESEVEAAIQSPSTDVNKEFKPLGDAEGATQAPVVDEASSPEPLGTWEAEEVDPFAPPAERRKETSGLRKGLMLLVVILVGGLSAYFLKKPVLQLMGLNQKKEMVRQKPPPRREKPKITTEKVAPKKPATAQVEKVTKVKKEKPSTPAPKISPAPKPIAPPKPALALLTELRNIRHRRLSNGTLVILSANGAFSDANFSHVRVGGDRPREVIKLKGVRRPFGTPQIQVNTPELKRVRTGFHQGKEGSELHIVLDLAGAKIKARNLSPSGKELRIELGR